MKPFQTVSLLGSILILSTMAACASDSTNTVDSDVGSDRVSIPPQSEPSTAPSSATTNNQPEQAPETTQVSTRPSTKTDTISIEGEKSEVTLKLYDKQSQLFTTYFPQDDFVVESASSGADAGSIFYYNVDGNKNKDVSVSISFPTWANNAEQLERLLTAKGGLVQKNQWQMEDRTKEVPYSWAKEKILYKQPGSEENLLAQLYIGEANGKVFYVITRYPAEYGDGFAPRADFILKNLDVKG
ncbi:MAG TPA: hypothetical protein V6D26_20085 [Stenomitos sp.]